jgi:putative hemolysin
VSAAALAGPFLGGPFLGGPFFGGPFLGGPLFGGPFFGGLFFGGSAEAMPAGLMVDPFDLLLACGALLLATLGSVTASALLVYSPTKLARDDVGRRLNDYLGEWESEYQVVARLLMIGGVAAAALLGWHSSPLNPGLAVTAVLVLALPACGVVPALFAEQRAERVLLVTIPLLQPLRLPLRWILLLPTLAAARVVLRLLRVPDARRVAEPDEIAGDILAAVTDSAQEQALPEEERSWIENIVELKDRRASEIATPRTEMVALPASMRLDEAIRKAVEAGFSRYPVYRERIDDMVGVFYAKDALALTLDPTALATKTVGEVARKPLFVPASIDLVELLRQLRATKRQLAMVLDEYGGTAGLVTIEDVLEEIVGDIEDEYDPGAENVIRVVEPRRVIEVFGRTRVADAIELLGEVIPESESYDTVAGWIFASLDRIPRTGEVVNVGGVEVRILEADNRRIARVRLELRDAQPQDPSPSGSSPTHPFETAPAASDERAAGA